MKRLTVNASIDNLPAVLEFIDAELEAVGCSKKIQYQIDIAVEEIYVNVAHYAYAPGEGSATVELDFRGEPLLAVIRFIDEGKPYNPLENDSPDITLSAEERKIGGLGILLTKKTMDAVEYCFSGNQNILTIKKSLS